MQLYNNIGFTQSRRRVYTQIMSDDVQNLDKFVDEVERDLLSHIYANLKAQEINSQEAQKIAQDFLKLLPFKDKKDLLDKLNTLGHEYRTAQEVYVKYGEEFEEQERQRKLNLMRMHIKSGEINKALEVAKQHYGK